MNSLLLGLGAFQVALPALLIVCNAIVAPASPLALLLRAAAILALLVYVALAGMWLFPPWWTPYALGLFHFAGTLWAWRRLRVRRASPPAAWRRRLEPAVAGAVMAALAVATVPAVAGRVAPAGTVDLAPPLGAGTYYVVSGGGTNVLNVHLATLTGERFRPYRGQSYAVDLIAVDALGLRAHGVAPSDPAAYFVYGAEVRAPCAGEVAVARDGLPDLPVPETDPENLAGNHVVIDCGGHAVALAHLKRGSVAVGAGAAVRAGDAVGQVGNSGNTSEPHLHVHVQRGVPEDAPLSGEPLWFTVAGRFLARGDLLRVP